MKRLFEVSMMSLLLILASSSDLPAETHLVPDDFDTIQEAIDEAEDGDVIEVDAGTYTENIDFASKSVTLRSLGDASDTIIDGSDQTFGSDMASVLSFSGTTGEGSTIEGFTITSGSGNEYTYDVTGSSFTGGGGIFAIDSIVTIRDCVITDNENGGIHAREESALVIESCTIADNLGTGIQILIESDLVLTGSTISANGDVTFDTGGVSTGSDCSAEIDSCSFIDNDGFVGGGAAIQNDATITNCIFEGNEASYAGGLFLGEGNTVESCQFIGNVAAFSAGALSEGGTTFRRCLFDSNEADESGGALSSESMGDPIIVENCTLVGNSALIGGAVWISDTPLPSDVEFELSSCIIWDNDGELFEAGESTIAIEYSDVEGTYDGDGNIDTDPEFVDPDEGDYRLALGSSCIDAGDPDTFDVDGSRVDMGAFAYRPFFLRGDTDGNGEVSALVDSLFLMRWSFQYGPEPPCLSAADIDDSGSVSTLLEIIYLMRYAFTGGETPPAPGVTTCDQDPTLDLTSCETPPDCL